jgi:hypothetical protein
MGKSKSSKFRREKRDYVARRNEEEMQRQQAENSVLKLTEFVTVSELASMMNKQPTEIIKACMQLGIFASLNQRLDAETIAHHFGRIWIRSTIRECRSYRRNSRRRRQARRYEFLVHRL